jgi:hypothetical protein
MLRLPPITSSAPFVLLTEKKKKSFAAVTIAGIIARVLLCDDVVQCRLSTRFVETHMTRKARLSVGETVISASLNLTSFTCVVEFVLDPSLNFCDAVLGLDWSRRCHNVDMQCLAQGMERLEGQGE